jgi:4-amino-4-deoxy-L-arabinose transferase-like glycosyltransferase
MSNIFIQFLLLLAFSFALAAVVSCYRDDEPKEVLRGIPRRMALFAGTVTGLAVLAYVLGVSFLAPGGVPV